MMLEYPYLQLRAAETAFHLLTKKRVSFEEFEYGGILWLCYEIEGKKYFKHNYLPLNSLLEYIAERKTA